MIDPDRDEKLCEAANDDVMTTPSLRTEATALLKEYIAEVRKLQKEVLELTTENHDQKTDLDKLRDWQRDAKRYLPSALFYLEDKLAYDDPNCVELRQLIEEAK